MFNVWMGARDYKKGYFRDVISFPLSFSNIFDFFLSSGVLAEAAVVPGQLRGVQQQQDQTEIGRHHQRVVHHQNFNQEISEN